MSKFLDRLEKIRDGAPAPLGFGLGARAEKLPGMALVGLVSSGNAAQAQALAEKRPDGVLLDGAKSASVLKKLKKSLSAVSWGVRVASMNEAEAQAYQDLGCDLLAFPLQDVSMIAVASDKLARILCIEPNLEERDLLAISSLPVDVMLLSMDDVSSPWTLQDLATVGLVRSYVGQHLLLKVSGGPTRKELEVLRDIGVQGLVVDVGQVTPEALDELKTALLEMPKPKHHGERTRALLPSAGFAVPQPHLPQRKEDDDEDE